MKKDIHPKYFSNSKVQCACGANFEVGSTKEAIETEVCFKCHPFYTGKEKIIDTAGRVEKFKQRMAKKQEKPIKKNKAKKVQKKKAILL
ncbi:50S ribosomal protein L31 [Candidatus Parcubacteria bacterium]|nr:50S ribosomal protein L31 [Candidatus Parcubacteria bacterium]